LAVASEETNNDRRGWQFWVSGFLAAQSDYIQNGFILPKDPKNLELFLRDVHQKGFFEQEVCYKFKQKEELKGIEREIADRIENPLKEGTPLFLRVFERCLS
jgi:hypothetical protein